MKWQDIPDVVKGIVVVGGFLVWAITYHDQFMTVTQAAEQQLSTEQQISGLLVVGLEAEKRALIKEKAKAIEAGDAAESDKVEQNIQTLRDRIKGVCERNELKDC